MTTPKKSDQSLEHKVEELQDTLSRIEAALGSIEEMILWTDADGRLKWCNETFAGWLDKPRVTLLSKPLTELLPLASMGQRLPDAAHPVTQALTIGLPQDGEYESESGVPLRLKASPMLEDDITGLTVLIQDMTEERELEEFRLRGVAMSAAVNAVAILDGKGRIQWVNKAFTDITGYTLDEVYDRSLRVLKSGEQNKAYYRKLWDTVLSGSPWEGTLVNRNKAGELYHEFQSITPVLDEGGTTSAFVVFKQDVTEQVKSREALQQLNEKLEHRVAERTAEVREGEALMQSLLSGLGAAFLVVDDDGVVADCNAIAETRFGVTRGEALGEKACDMFAHLDEQTAAALCAIGDDEPAYQEIMIRTADGAPQFAARHLLETTLKDVPHTALVFFDITEKKGLERQLSVTQKLESIGQLASGIAHEINTPIQYVGDSVRFAKEAAEDVQTVISAGRQLGEAAKTDKQFIAQTTALDEAVEEADLEFLDEELPRAFDRALEGVERVADIVRAMKNFSHPGTGEKKAVDLNHAVETTVTVARNEWKYAATVETDLDPDLPKVLGLPGDLNQVILNIVVNAAHAIAEKVGDSGDMGVIAIATEQAGDMARLTVADTGGGIPEANQDRVFDPFFTTKEPGKGTGQGLAIAHDIVVNKHGGSLDIESEPGQGARFIITLPLVDGAEEAA